MFILSILDGVPVLPGLVIKFWIWKQTQAHDAGRVPVHFRIRLTGRCVFWLPNVQAELVGSARHFGTGFDRESYRTPSFSANFIIRREVAQLQQIHEPVTVPSKVIPKHLVTGGPQHPGIAALDFVWG